MEQCDITYTQWYAKSHRSLCTNWTVIRRIVTYLGSSKWCVARAETKSTLKMIMRSDVKIYCVVDQNKREYPRRYAYILRVTMNLCGIVTPYGVRIDSGNGLFLTVPSHYFNECWLLIVEIMWRSYVGMSIKTFNWIFWCKKTTFWSSQLHIILSKCT